MNQPIVSFESPIALLEASKQYNDYDYALVHLFDQNPEYKDFYLNAIKDRIVYLDNSAYELGESFDPETFIAHALELAAVNAENLRVFIPDYPSDPERSVGMIKSFPEISYLGGQVKRIGVAHGASFKEIIDNITEIAPYCDLVAIPMMSVGFELAETLQDRTARRQQLVKLVVEMMRAGLISRKPLHLLGCLLPQEFLEYSDAGILEFIESIDTSNPILHGLEGIVYKRDGLETKSNTKMADLMGVEVTAKMMKNIEKNIQMFFKINNLPRTNTNTDANANA